MILMTQGGGGPKFRKSWWHNTWTLPNCLTIKILNLQPKIQSVPVTPYQIFLSVDSRCAHRIDTTSVFRISIKKHNFSMFSTFSYITHDSRLNVYMLFAAFFLLNPHPMQYTLSIQIYLHLHIKQFPSIEWLNGLNYLCHSYIFPCWIN